MEGKKVGRGVEREGDKAEREAGRKVRARKDGRDGRQTEEGGKLGEG